MPALTLAEKVDALMLIVGDWSTPPVLASGGKPKELINGKLDLKESDWQLHNALDGLVGTANTEGLVPKLQRLLLAQATEITELRERLDALPATTPPVPIPAGSLDVVAGLAALNIHVGAGRMSIGRPVDYQTQACLQLGGDGVAAEMQGVSNTKGTDGQNAGEPHLNTWVLCDNDGGARVRQYMKWWNGKQRNTTNRPGSIFAFFDSYGDTCISDDRIPYGQVFYLVKDFAAKAIRICGYQPGWAVNLRESPGAYGDPSKVVAGTPQ